MVQDVIGPGITSAKLEGSSSEQDGQHLAVVASTDATPASNEELP